VAICPFRSLVFKLAPFPFSSNFKLQFSFVYENWILSDVEKEYLPTCFFIASQFCLQNIKTRKMTKIEPGMLAIVTGGGAGMGKELCMQLVQLGCKVATCDVNEENLKKTADYCATVKASEKIFIYKCDVSMEKDCVAFKEATLAHFDCSHVNLLFNNAGLSGGGSFVASPRDDWEACFNICWGGVYNMTRAFMPHLLNAKTGHIINTSSLNGLWACIGASQPHTAYSTAKFAVRGFTESLIVDLRLNAPHIGVSLVCPGHIGTDIVRSSQEKAYQLYGNEALQRTKKAFLQDPLLPDATKKFLEDASPEQVQQIIEILADQFKNTGMSASDAATYILNAVEANEWRVLPGKDAEQIDLEVRRRPEEIYSKEFILKAMELFNREENSNLEEQERRLNISKSKL